MFWQQLKFSPFSHFIWLEIHLEGTVHHSYLPFIILILKLSLCHSAVGSVKTDDEYEDTPTSEREQKPFHNIKVRFPFVFWICFSISTAGECRAFQQPEFSNSCCHHGWWGDHRKSNSNNFLQLHRQRVRSPAGPPPLHWMYTRAPCRTRCCCCVATAESLIFSLITIPTPLLLNNRAYGPPCLPLCPQQMRRTACSSSRSHMMKQPEPLISL